MAREGAGWGCGTTLKLCLWVSRENQDPPPWISQTTICPGALTLGQLGPSPEGGEQGLSSGTLQVCSQVGAYPGRWSLGSEWWCRTGWRWRCRQWPCRHPTRSCTTCSPFTYLPFSWTILSSFPQALATLSFYCYKWQAVFHLRAFAHSQWAIPPCPHPPGASLGTTSAERAVISILPHPVLITIHIMCLLMH